MDKTLKIILLLSVIIIGVLIGLLFVFKAKEYTNLHPSSSRVQQALNNQSTSQFYRDLIPKDTVNLNKTPGVKTAPEFKINQYSLDTASTKISDTAKIFSFKTNYSFSEIDSIANMLLGPIIAKEEIDKNQIAFSGQLGYLTFNKTSGAFIYQGIGIKLPFPVTSQTADLRKPISDFLRDDLKIIDNFTKATSYYRREGSEGVTYVEYHHDWDLIGAPIISIAAVPAMSERVSFQDLSLTKFQDTDQKDNSIYFASDQPGFARRVDFNSATVAYTKDGYIISIESNLRYILKEESLEERGLSLFNSESLVGELNNKGGYFKLAIPSGEGIINLEKVFPNNTLSAQKAIVTDVVLAYLEKTGDIEQKYLFPNYIVRGYAETETGYRVNFAESIPAIDDKKLSLKKNGVNYFASLIELKYPILAMAQEIGLTPTLVPSPTPITLYCQDDSIECNYQIFKPTPTTATSITPSVTLIPTLTPQPSTYIPTPSPLPSIYGPTPRPSPTTKVYPSPTPDTKPCFLTDYNGRPIADIQTISIFVPGLGTVYFFPGQKIAAAYKRSYRSVVNSNMILDFQNIESRELQKRFAETILRDPNLIIFDNFGHLDLVTTALKAFNFDMRKTYNNRGLSSTKTPEYIVLQNSLESAVRVKTVDSSVVGPPITDYPSLQKIARFETGLSSIPFGTLYQSLILTRQGGGSSLNASKLRLSPSDCQPVTTMSPSIYFYPGDATTISLIFGHNNISFADPFILNRYTLNVSKNGSLDFDGIRRNRFYYEYKNTEFNQPKQGWVIKTDKIIEFIC